MASFWTIFTDALAIVSAWTSQNGPALIAAVNKLLADLGLAPLHETARLAVRTDKDTAFNPLAIFGDIVALWQAVKARNQAAIAIALAKLLADLGIVL